MTRVRIVQLLCPSRHCIMATAYESPDGEEIPEIAARLRERVDGLIAANEMNPRCGLCFAKTWRYEDHPTNFTTMKEALPALRQAERANAATRQFFRASRG